jgi:iron complex outermembrane recepter protein
VEWAKVGGRNHLLTAGVDWRWVDGDSNEDAYAAATPTVVIPPVTIAAVKSLARVSGGTQQISGAFLQDLWTPVPKATITLSARVDHWSNTDGHNLETAIIPGTAANNQPSLAARSDTVFSPRAAALYHLTDQVSVWGAMSTGFRAPTLNELYRQFRVGAILTLANVELGPERLVGGELGVNLAPTRNTTIRTTYYDNRMKNPVANVTIAANTLQRQNLGRTRIRGVQLDGDYRFHTDLKLTASYLYNDAKVTEFNPTPAPPISLVGKFLPQVPKHRGTIGVSYTNPKYVTVGFDVEAMGLQYNDDQNVMTIPARALDDAGYSSTNKPGLPGYAVANLSLSRRIMRDFDVFFGVQNMFDKTYFVNMAPTLIGSPRVVSGGFRLRFSGR